jgi:alkyl sulfatase BDS1-like metallo-beta-lactamase superfamily hydrolase
MMNLGYRPTEIADALELPAGLDASWSVRGYYGTVSHNAKAVYQRYLSWYDGNPATLNPLPPADTAAKTVEYMGGAAAVLRRARADFGTGQFRWVAQVTSQLVFADPDNREARELAADALEQLGYQAESATWRNAYLYGAQELRHGVVTLPPRPVLSPDLLAAVGTDTVFDLLAVRLNPQRASGQRLRINWHVTDTGERVVLNLEHATLTHTIGTTAADARASVRATRPTLDAIAVRRGPEIQALVAEAFTIDGDADALRALLGMLDDFDLMFDVVTPRRARR